MHSLYSLIRRSEAGGVSLNGNVRIGQQDKSSCWVSSSFSGQLEEKETKRNLHKDLRLDSHCEDEKRGH